MALFLDVDDKQKRELLSALGLLHALKQGGEEVTLEHWIQCARVHCLSKIESYFLQDASQLRQPLNLRNEAAAVSLLLAHWSARQAGGEQQQLLTSLLEYGRTLWPELASGDVALSSLSTAGGSVGGGADRDSSSNSSSSSGGDSSSAGGLSGRPVQAKAVAVEPPRGVPAPPGSPAADFEAWAREQGVGSAITIASFGALRGCAAARDVQPGEPLLSIPSDVLIYEDSVRQTDLGRMLMAIPGLTIDNLLIIFTMIDRHDPDSKWARYWRSLPDKYYTGLSFPEQLVEELKGTAAHLELQRAQAHLRRQYSDTQPLFQMLLQAYPQFLQPDWFDYDSYLWAAELWYSYAFEVQFPEAAGNEVEAAAAEAGAAEEAAAGGSKAAAGRPAKPRARQMGGAKGGKSGRGGSRSSTNSAGSSKKGGALSAKAAGGSSKDKSSSSGGGSSSSKPVMVPFACHVNHSPWPHCVRYGKVNPATGTLDYPAFRPCKEGQQVYISYGPVPNLKLLCYYGFVVPHNPHDLVPLLLEPPHGPLHDKHAAALQRLGLGLEHNLQDGPLSKQLLACLRVIVSTADELAAVRQRSCDPLFGPINKENEAQALQTLQAALEGMLAPLLRLPLLAGGAAGADNEGEEAAAGQQHQKAGDGPAAAQTAGQQAGEEHQQTNEQQHAEQQDADRQQAKQPEQPDRPSCNENGFDADWRMSRHFCRVYLEGQLAILRRSLEECRQALAVLQE